VVLAGLALEELAGAGDLDPYGKVARLEAFYLGLTAAP
jgi:hypothetical protein